MNFTMSLQEKHIKEHEEIVELEATQLESVAGGGVIVITSCPGYEGPNQGHDEFVQG
jgi:hypothetical protein